VLVEWRVHTVLTSVFSHHDFFFFSSFTLITGPTRSLGLRLSDTRVYEPQIRARLGTTAHFCEVVVLKFGWGSSEQVLVDWRVHTVLTSVFSH